MKIMSCVGMFGLLAVVCFGAMELADEPLPKVKPVAAKNLTSPEPADDLGVVLDLQDGSHIVGRIAPRNLAVVIHSESIGEVKIPLERIRGIQFATSNQQVVVTLQNGDKLQGGLAQESFKLQTVFGKVVIPTKFAKRLAVAAARTGKPPDGCVLWYSFDADEGDRVTDKSGRDHHGRVDGAQYMNDGKIGGAYQFGRGEKQMWVPDGPVWNLENRPFTIALWVSLTAQPAGRFMIAKDDGPGGKNKWGLGFFQGGLCFHLNGPRVGECWIAQHSFTPELKRWYHLALTRDGSTYKLYLDGKNVRTDESTTQIPRGSSDLTIGQGEGLGIDGMLDEVMFFNRAQSADEVKDLYDSQK